MTTHTIPARRGIAVFLKSGQSIKVINTHGTQVVDAFAFSIDASTSTMTPPARQHLSMPHTRASLNKIIPGVGDTMTSNERKAMVMLVEDTTKGVHDTLVAACDRWRYEELGVVGYHENCADNMDAALRAVGVEIPGFTPSPLNLFMSIPVHEDRNTISFEKPTSEAGQYVVLRAEMDLVMAFSACPQDILSINCGKPVDAHYEIL